MKDLDPAKKILGMRISRERKKTLKTITSRVHIEKVMRRFNMVDAKPANVLLRGQFKLSKAQELKIEYEKDLMPKVMYVSVVGNLTYVMVCTRPDIAQPVRAVSRQMSNLGQKQWRAVK